MKKLNSLTKKLQILTIGLMLLGLVVLPSTVLAADADKDCKDDVTGTAIPDCTPGGGGSDGSCTTSLDCEAGYTCKITSGTSGTCEADTFGLNPVGNQVSGKLGNQDLRETAANLINVLLGLLGLIAVVIVLAGGFKWMTSGGSDDKTGEAKKMIGAGVIGLAIILSAWAISLFVINQLSTATNAGADIPDQDGV